MTDDNSTPEDPEVGYGKPPKASQFKPGQSGNPKGRPKGPGNIHKIITKHAAKKVTVIENGVEKKMQKLDVVISAMFNKASKADVSAARLLTTLIQGAHELSAHEDQSGYNEADLAVMLEQADWQAQLVDLRAEASDEDQ
jgi:Family of unknown function (DUF5681)